VANEGDLGDLEDDLDVCQSIEAWPGAGWVRVGRNGREGDPDDVLQTCFSLPIYSLRLRSALDSAGISGIQYLPIQVIRATGEAIPDFCIANLLNCLDALDLERSIVERFPADYFLPGRRGRIRSVNHPILVRDVLTGYDIIRLSRYRASIYVSERFVRLFESERFTGYSFREVPAV
jgi:hypothetical protein